MMKTHIKKARVFVTGKYKTEGSVLRETVKAAGLGFSTRLELESDEPAEKIAAVVRNAENGCYVMQCLLNPVPIERTVKLNGAEFNPQDSSR
jgi:hypothetical protein